MAKAARVLAALKRDGWVEVRRKGSHRWLAKGERRGTWAWHDGDDLGGPVLPAPLNSDEWAGIGDAHWGWSRSRAPALVGM